VTVWGRQGLKVYIMSMTYHDHYLIFYDLVINFNHSGVSKSNLCFVNHPDNVYLIPLNDKDSVYEKLLDFQFFDSAAYAQNCASDSYY
jgi:hypothetical protein